MKKVIFNSLFAFSLILISCNNEKENLEKEVENIDSIEYINPINISEYEGTYKGILPCIKSDCEDIELSVQLLPDHQFIYATKRVNIDTEPLMTTGSFDFDSEKNIIVLEQIANVPNSFYLEGNKLYQLDKNQQKITGENASRFILSK